jgi:hypothetical protein
VRVWPHLLHLHLLHLHLPQTEVMWEKDGEQEEMRRKHEEEMGVLEGRVGGSCEGAGGWCECGCAGGSG